VEGTSVANLRRL
jgi:DNA repair exonuclease SbcCD ATPase subunit